MACEVHELECGCVVTSFFPTNRKKKHCTDVSVRLDSPVLGFLEYYWDRLCEKAEWASMRADLGWLEDHIEVELAKAPEDVL